MTLLHHLPHFCPYSLFCLFKAEATWAFRMWLFQLLHSAGVSTVSETCMKYLAIVLCRMLFVTQPGLKPAPSELTVTDH